MGLACGCTAEEALSETQRRHDAREDSAWPLSTRQRSPQTDVQVAQVRMLLEALEDVQ
jgi:hypothetical protein